MRPITITLPGETGWHLLMALKEELTHGKPDKTAVRVYEEVIEAIIAGMALPSSRPRAVSRDP
jgi:hypothetical protein